MSQLKYIITIMCSSFTFVVILNAMLNLFDPYHFSMISSMHIVEIFMICLIIAIVIIVGDALPILRKYYFLYTYAVMLLVACGYQSVFYHYSLESLLIQVIFLTLVWIGVWFCFYCVHQYDAKKINEKIEKRRERKSNQ